MPLKVVVFPEKYHHIWIIILMYGVYPSTWTCNYNLNKNKSSCTFECTWAAEFSIYNVYRPKGIKFIVHYSPSPIKYYNFLK